MNQDKEKTVVVFRKWRKAYRVSELCDIIALFPELEGSGPSNCQSFEHVGQHGSADYQLCIHNSVPASQEEYASTAKELEQNYGYNLEIRKRFQFKPFWKVKK